LLEPGARWARRRHRDGWRWSDGAGGEIAIRADGPDLSLAITRAGESTLSARLPSPSGDDIWIIPDGEGVAFAAADPFWRNEYRREQCLNATGGLALPAWGVQSGDATVTVMLADGLQSALCLRDEEGVQARLTHRFSAGAERLEILIHVGRADLLAPALAYRALLQRRGQLKRFADKQVPRLTRLYGAPHAYVWGDGRTLGLLDSLHTLGVARMLLTYDQNDDGPGPLVGPEFLARARELGYLAGPYELFEAAQPPESAEMHYTNWGDELYPDGCIRDADGAVVTGFAGRGCHVSSEALRQRTTPPNPASRYARHQRGGAGTVFVDSDAFGGFRTDFSPAHPMTMARDRENLLARLNLGIQDYGFVLGSEHVHAWSHGVSHYSHGTAQIHPNAIWRLMRDRERVGSWHPPERPGSFFKRVTLDARETRALFGAADQLPLFEAAFHDSVVSTDRWGSPLTKFIGLERERFARALLFGTPTMWSLDAAELERAGLWLKAAHDAFRRAHGWDAPVALTGFSWLTPDRLVQQTRFADGREIIANLSDAPWRGIGPDCVRVARRRQAQFEVCPPDSPILPLAD
jgi:hypothetical protein